MLVLAAVSITWLNQRNPAVQTPTPASVEQVNRVSLADAKAAYDAKSAIFLDVRDSNSYAISHIPGAVLMPLSELSSRIGELDPSTWIIPYCT